MKINSAKLIYFSPTGTTKTTIEGISQGMHLATVEHVDLTPPDAGKQKLVGIRDELAILGSPVYGGRLPADAVSRLRRIKGNGVAAAIIVVYGNRAYEDALLELRDLAVEAGFKPVAAGAFIGEHSYSTAATPIAIGRPDGDDLKRAGEFGKMIREKLENLQSLDEVPPLSVPGHFPYKERGGLSNISPVTQESLCLKCQNCAAACPTAAITVADTVVTDRSLCIRCCACVKICSIGARVMDDPRILPMAKQLSISCSDRKEPEMYV